MAPKQPFARENLRGPRRRARSLASRILDRALEPAGFNVTMQHFYSPIPGRGSLSADFWNGQSKMPGLTPFDLERQFRFLEGDLAPLIAEFTPPRDPTARPHEFFLRNGTYQGGDADVLYAMVRHFQPDRIIELGAGNSTLVAATACQVNRERGHETAFWAYDPFAVPPDRAVPGLSGLAATGAEHIPLTTFEDLKENDILFIDSTHVVRIGGDVIFLILEILPRLRPGVIVHLHDIFLPWHYPRKWIEHNRWYWAEQYLLQAFLAFNRDFEVLLPVYPLLRSHPERFSAAIPNYDPAVPPPMAFWMRRTAPSVREASRPGGAP